MLLLCSTYLTVLLSGDRYFLICWPLIAEKIRTRKMSLRLVLLVFILVNLYILPHWFEYQTEIKSTMVNDSVTNLTLNNSEHDFTITNNNELYELTYTPLGSDRIYLSIYRFYLNVPVTFVMPFTLLTFCNSSMIHKLLLIRQKRKRLGHRMKADIRMTIMLIVIVLTFMLCRSVNLFVNLFVQLSPCLNQNSLQRFNAFANLLIAFNGFINFFLFAVFGQRFREMVLYIFFRHGRYPFSIPVDAMSVHRATLLGTKTSSSRKRSRRVSANDLDSWAAMSRRRPSATMAVIYNTSSNRPRSASHLISDSSRLQIPTDFNNEADTSNSLMDIAKPSSPNPSYQRLSTNTNDKNMTIMSSLSIPDDNRPKNLTPTCIKKKKNTLTSTIIHRVKFV